MPKGDWVAALAVGDIAQHFALVVAQDHIIVNAFSAEVGNRVAFHAEIEAAIAHTGVVLEGEVGVADCALVRLFAGLTVSHIADRGALVAICAEFVA